MKLPKETEDIIIDLYTNTKMSIARIISLIDQKNLYREFTLEDFYSLLYERQNIEGRRINRTTNDYNSDFDNQIYQWRNEGKNIGEIIELLKEKGIDIKEEELLNRVVKIFKRKDNVDLRIIKWREGSIEINKDECKEIKSTCHSYKDIQTYFKNKGINIPYTAIKLKFRGWVKQNNQDINEAEGEKKNSRFLILEGREDEVFSLREKKTTYDDIAKQFQDKGIKVSRETVRKKCKEIYEKEGKEEPKGYKQTLKRDIEEQIIETVYELRKYKKYTYQDILEYLTAKGINVDYTQIVRLCKKTFKEKNEREPKSKREVARIVNNRVLAYQLKRGKSCREITEYFNNKGISVSYSFVVDACRRIKHNQVKYKKQQLSKAKNKNLIIDTMLKIGEKRKATQEQMKKFAEEISNFYGEDIKFDFEDKKLKMNLVNEKEKDEIER